MKTMQQNKTPLSVPFEIKAVDEERRTFRGLASTWELDLGRDVIHKGAFARTLDHWRASKTKRPIFLLDQHNYYSIRHVLGKMISAEEAESGLEAEFQIIDGPDGDEALRRIKGGFITGLSIGYRPVKWSLEQMEGGESWERIRHLTEVRLEEVSLVIFPMNEGARIDADSVKGILAALGERALSDEEAEALRALPTEARAQLRALLDDPEPDAPESEGDEEPEEKGLAPEDPERIAMEAMLRELEMRSLGIAA